MGHEISSHSTWTQGIMALQILNILENFDLKAMGHNSPAYTHTVLEATKLAFADREAYYGDPNYATVPIDGLISKEYAAERAQKIDPERACPEPACRRQSVEILCRYNARQWHGANTRWRSRGRVGQQRWHDAHRLHRPRRQPRLRHSERRLFQQGRLLP